MIRQVSHAQWMAILAAQPDGGVALKAALTSIQDTREAESGDLARRYYRLHEIDKTTFDALESASSQKVLDWALASRYYENVTEETLQAEDRDALVEAVQRHPDASILTIMTRITNYYRNKQGKSDLTEAQVRSRLLA
jgi:hypothetical protein